MYQFIQTKFEIDLIYVTDSLLRFSFLVQNKRLRKFRQIEKFNCIHGPIDRSKHKNERDFEGVISIENSFKTMPKKICVEDYYYNGTESKYPEKSNQQSSK